MKIQFLGFIPTIFILLFGLYVLIKETRGGDVQAASCLATILALSAFIITFIGIIWGLTGTI
jgi:hypothetical protein